MSFESKLKAIKEEIANTKALLKIEGQRELELLQDMKDSLNIEDEKQAQERIKAIKEELQKNDDAMKRLIKTIEDELYGTEDQ